MNRRHSGGAHLHSLTWMCAIAVFSATLSLSEAAPAQTLTERAPAVSPDGMRLVFQSNRDGDVELYVADLSDGSIVRLTHHPGLDGGPRWSPDGTMLAFYSDRDGNVEVYTVRSDGSDLRRRTRHEAMDLMPTWSLDGTEIRYASDRDGDQLRIVDLESGDDRLVSTATEHHNPVTPAPTGDVLAAVLKDGSDWDLALIGVDGELQQELDSDPARAASPSWSPDGSRVVYASRRTGDWDLYLVSVGGGAPVRLTSGENRELDPHWAPDGRWIYFASNASGSFLLYRIRPDGTGAGRVLPGRPDS